MSTDPYAHFDAAYVLGALDPGDRVAFEAHLETCVHCRGRVAETATLPSLLAGVGEGAFGDDLDGPAPCPVAAAVPDTLLPGLLRKARRVRARRRVATGGLGAVAAACLAALLVVVWPSAGAAAPSRPMTALVASPVGATVALQPEAWGTQVDMTCWYRYDGAPPAGGYDGNELELVAYDTSGRPHELGSWQLVPGKKITFTGGTALSVGEIANVKITDSDGTPLLALTR